MHQRAPKTHTFLIKYEIFTREVMQRNQISHRYLDTSRSSPRSHDPEGTCKRFRRAAYHPHSGKCRAPPNPSPASENPQNKKKEREKEKFGLISGTVGLGRGPYLALRPRTRAIL